MDSSRPTLRLVPGNRRAEQRTPALPFDILLSGTIGNAVISSCQVQFEAFGKLALHVHPHDSMSSLQVGETIPVILNNSEDCIVSGFWKLVAVRPLETVTNIVIEIPGISCVAALSHYVDPSVLLRPGRFRILRSDSAPDIKDLNRHFTDLVDFSKSVHCSIHKSDGSHIAANFNFEAKRKSLDFLDFSVEAQTQLAPGEEITVEYKFLTVRYLFSTAVAELDPDFGLASVPFPSAILAITARRYDRWKTNISLILSDNSTPQTCAATLAQYSPSGGELTLAEPAPWIQPGKTLDIQLGNTLHILATVRSCTTESIQVSFSKSLNTPEKLRDLFSLTIQKPLLLRKSEMAPLFTKLYTDVGYAPDGPSQIQEWQRLTLRAWDILDSKMPGNTIGALDGDILAIAFSAIPLSSLTVYGHSLAMLRTLGAVANFSDVALHNLAWTEFLESVQYYCGSARYRSAFATRLHTVFETHSAPETYRIFHALAVMPGSTPIEINSGSYTCEEVTEQPLDGIPIDQLELIKKISDPHTLISEHHRIRTFSIRSIDSRQVAIAVAHCSPQYFTAANILRCVWLFILNDTVDVDQVHAVARSHEFMRDLEIDIFAPNLEKPPAQLKTPCEQEEIFWYLFHKDEFGPILASINRAAWSILRKYGPEADEYLARMLS